MQCRLGDHKVCGRPTWKLMQVGSSYPDDVKQKLLEACFSKWQSQEIAALAVLSPVKKKEKKKV